MYDDWTAELRLEARAEVARVRTAKGLPPWDWKDGPSKTPEDVMNEVTMESNNRMYATSAQKTCACGCNESFVTCIPGKRYKHGHKPESEKIKARKAPPALVVPKPTAAGTVEDASRSYIIARANMDREIALLDSQIECVDDEIEKLRVKIRALFEDKQRHLDRHELITASREALKALCEPVRHDAPLPLSCEPAMV